MKHKFIAAAMLLALSGGALAKGPQASRIIEHLDQDGDSLISIDEFKGPRGNRLEAADANSDGAVTLEEMKAHRDARHQERMEEMQARRAEHEARMDEMFASMDTDGDGAVTPEEARKAMFSRMDENGDGYLSEDEMRPRRGMRDKKHGKHGRRHHGPDSWE